MVSNLNLFFVDNTAKNEFQPNELW